MPYQFPDEFIVPPFLLEVGRDVSVTQKGRNKSRYLDLGGKVFADPKKWEYVWVIEQGPHKCLPTEVLLRDVTQRLSSYTVQFKKLKLLVHTLETLSLSSRVCC